jgi:hypothetical protein
VGNDQDAKRGLFSGGGQVLLVDIKPRRKNSELRFHLGRLLYRRYRK